MENYCEYCGKEMDIMTLVKNDRSQKFCNEECKKEFEEFVNG